MIRTTRGEERGKVRLRFVEFELEGLSSTIEESIKSLVSSMNRANGGSLPNQQRTNGLPRTAKVVASNAADNSKEAVQGNLELDMDSDTLRTEESSPDRPKTTRHYTQPEFLEDFDLDSGEKPFKTYATEIEPETDNHRYLVIAAWSKQWRNLESITNDHVYTCYQKMGWKSQRDVGQPFRKMKKASLFQSPSRGQWKITHIGLDRVKDGPVDSDSDSPQ
jgi:uncharacterized protein YjhX (UPF0386 family)